jgi:PP-loop superfamily ATP-utilizing enzyme
MTVHLDWPPDLVSNLTEEAHYRGLSLEAYLLQTVLNQRSPNGSAVSDETAKRVAREEAGRSIRDLRKGNVLGPDVTIRDLVEEGRRF